MSMISFKLSKTSLAVIFYTDKVGIVFDGGELYFGNNAEAAKWIVKHQCETESDIAEVYRVLKC